MKFTYVECSRLHLSDTICGRIVEVGKGLEMTVKEQQEQGQVKHEKGEGEMTER